MDILQAVYRIATNKVTGTEVYAGLFPSDAILMQLKLVNLFLSGTNCWLTFAIQEFLIAFIAF